MAAEVLFTGPKPAAGERFCMVCSYTWKAAAIERFEAEIKLAAELPDGHAPVVIVVSDFDDMPPLATAVATGLFAPLSQFGPLELCWSHLNAVTLRSAGGLHLPPPGGGLPAGGFGGLNGHG
jgi:hypothetical protein